MTSNNTNLTAADATGIQNWVHARQDQIVTGSTGAFRIDLNKLVDVSRTFNSKDEAVEYVITQLTGSELRSRVA